MLNFRPTAGRFRLPEPPGMMILGGTFALLGIARSSNSFQSFDP
jgi:hypothetical protein